MTCFEYSIVLHQYHSSGTRGHPFGRKLRSRQGPASISGPPRALLREVLPGFDRGQLAYAELNGRQCNIQIAPLSYHMALWA